MKKSLIILSIFLLSGLTASAVMIDKQFSDKEYMMNAGYSESMTDYINLSYDRAMGVKYQYPEEPEYYNMPVIKAIRKFFIYIDPALNDGWFEHHNNSNTPKYTDL